MIAAAIGIQTPLSHLTPLWGIRPMNIMFCFNRHFIRNKGPNDYELLINHEVGLHFTLPNHERTIVHNRDNWLYDLEVNDESPTLHDTLSIHEYHLTPHFDISYSSSSAGAPPHVERNDELITLRTELVAIRRDFRDFTDVSIEQMGHL